MRVLLTGATGFLGKQVLELLLADPRIIQIQVVTRRPLKHPDPKVRVIQADLSFPGDCRQLGEEFDAVIHLAGLYDFTQGFVSNYTQNVLPALNLAAKLRELNQKRRVPIYYASTFAVGYQHPGILDEKPLEHLAPKSFSYGFTKGVAEQALLSAGIPAFAFRLGVLVGTQEDGRIEKVDGPYYFFQILEKLARTPGARFLKRVPIPARPDAHIPLVPVDLAARTFQEALFHPGLAEEASGVYGLYSLDCVSVREMTEAVLGKYLPGSKPVYLNRVPEFLTRSRGEIFRFGLEPVRLDNSRFQERFPMIRLPRFEGFESALFQGYETYTKGYIPC